MSIIDHLFAPPTLFGLWTRARPPQAVAGRLAAGRGRPRDLHAERLFLHVRSVDAEGFEHLFQFALARDDGEIAASVYVRGRHRAEDDRAPAPVDPPVPILDRLQLAPALESCRGGWVVAFGRVLHGGFLPHETREAIASLDCARARFIKVARRQGIRVGPGDLADLNDARRLIGLPQVRSADAGARALGLRELWRWMDEADYYRSGRTPSQNRGLRS